MATFEDAYSDILDEARKPTSDAVMLARAKREVKSAIRFCNRNYPFKVLEALAEYSFPTATDTVTFTTIETGASITDGTILSIRAVELLGASGDASGYPLTLTELSGLHADRNRWLRLRPAGDEWEPSNTTDDQTNYDSYTTRNRKFWIYTVGKSLGLSPRPGSAQILKLLYHKEFTALSADGDTNALLDFAYDYIFLRAFRRFMMLEPESERPMLTLGELTQSWNELIAADKLLISGYPIT
jgi:hypothetical protein